LRKRSISLDDSSFGIIVLLSAILLQRVIAPAAQTGGYIVGERIAVDIVFTQLRRGSLEKAVERRQG
jgi:hypothetical protein